MEAEFPGVAVEESPKHRLGAFEVVDEETGELLYSKLKTGQHIRVSDFIEELKSKGFGN